MLVATFALKLLIAVSNVAILDDIRTIARMTNMDNRFYYYLQTVSSLQFDLDSYLNPFGNYLKNIKVFGYPKTMWS
jgi:hypothetical protein